MTVVAGVAGTISLALAAFLLYTLLKGGDSR